MEPTIGGASAAGDAFSRAGTFQPSDSPTLGSQLYKPKEGVTQEEKRGALARHTVTTDPVSRLELIGMGAMGGLVGATFGALARTNRGYSWRTVVTTIAIGTTTFALLASSNRSKTPLQHAQSELDQTQEDKECLLKRIVDNPDHKYEDGEIYTFKRLSERYGESWQTFELLWDVLYTKQYQDNYAGFLENFYTILRERLKATRKVIDDVLMKIALTDSLVEAKELPELQNLLRSIPRILIRNRDELPRMMFTYSRLLLSSSGPDYFRGKTPYEAYQTLCREKYDDFMNRITDDERRLLGDIRILRAIEEEDQSVLNF